MVAATVVVALAVGANVTVGDASTDSVEGCVGSGDGIFAGVLKTFAWLAAGVSVAAGSGTDARE